MRPHFRLSISRFFCTLRRKHVFSDSLVGRCTLHCNATGLSRHKLPSRCAVTIHTRESYNQVKGVTTLTGCCLVLTSSSFFPFRVNSFLQSAPNEASQSHP